MSTFAKWKVLGLLALVVASVAPFGAEAQLGFDPPHVLNANGGLDSGEDTSPALATDGNGNWLTVWSSTDALGGTVGSDGDIFVARSTDNGQTWSDPIVLNTNAGADSGNDSFPTIATDRAGNWVAVWTSSDTLGNTIGADTDLLVSRSSNNGSTWSAPIALNTNARTDTGSDFSPVLATDGNGAWVAVWSSTDTLAGTIGTDSDILVARSTNNGATWTAPAALNASAASDTKSDSSPTLATDGNGVWLAAWVFQDSVNGVNGTDKDLFVARSTNNGAIWTGQRTLNSSASIDTLRSDTSPDLTSDGSGNWIATWTSDNPMPGNVGPDLDIFVARSTNNGETWVGTTALNSGAANDNASDFACKTETDGRGNWVAVWCTDVPGDASGESGDLMVARSADSGVSWSTATFLNSNAAIDRGSDDQPEFATDGRGNWVAVWESDESLGNTIGSDLDILTASAIPPVVVKTGLASANPSNAKSVTYNVVFSEPVTGVDKTDFGLSLALSLTGAFIESVTGATTPEEYVVKVNTGAGNGTIRLMVNDNGSIKDNRGNKLAGLVPGAGIFNGEAYTMDRTNPSVSMASTAPNPTPVSPIPVTVTFTEPVFGFVAADIATTNATVQNFSGSGASYSFNLIPAAPGTVTADISSGKAADQTGNGNRAAVQFSRTFNGATLRVIAPNGGEQVKRGRNTAIQWTSSGTTGANVKVELLRNGSVVQTIFNSTPNDGAQQWAVPPTLATGNGYAIRVTSTKNAVTTDTSDAVFRIKNP